MKISVLTIHVDPLLGKLLEAAFEPGLFDRQTFRTGSAGLTAALERAPELVVIEIALPDIDGLVWLKILRQTKEGRSVPVVVASPKRSEEGAIQAFDLGADDFVEFRSCEPAELRARLRAVIRRRAQKEMDAERPITLGPVTLDAVRRECLVRGRPVTLRPREFECLEMLMRRAGRVLSRAFLLESVWGVSRNPDARTVDVTVSRVRKALGRRAAAWVETVERFGYRFRDPARFPAR